MSTSIAMNNIHSTELMMNRVERRCWIWPKRRWRAFRTVSCTRCIRWRFCCSTATGWRRCRPSCGARPACSCSTWTTTPSSGSTHLPSKASQACVNSTFPPWTGSSPSTRTRSAASSRWRRCGVRLTRRWSASTPGLSWVSLLTRRTSSSPRYIFFLAHQKSDSTEPWVGFFQFRFRGNAVPFVPRNLLPWSDLEIIDVQENPFVCDCSSGWMIQNLIPLLEEELTLSLMWVPLPFHVQASLKDKKKTSNLQILFKLT